MAININQESRREFFSPSINNPPPRFDQQPLPRADDDLIFDETPESPEELFERIFGGLGDFEKELKEQNQQFFDNPELAELQRQFTLLSEGRDPVIEAQRQRSLAEQSEVFTRRGVGGSALSNQLTGVGTLFDERQTAGRNEALKSRAGLEGQRLAAVQQGIENLGIPEAIAIQILEIMAGGEAIDFPGGDQAGGGVPPTAPGFPNNNDENEQS